MQIAIYILAGLALLVFGFAAGMFVGFRSGIGRALDLLKMTLREITDDLVGGKK